MARRLVGFGWAATKKSRKEHPAVFWADALGVEMTSHSQVYCVHLPK